MMRMMNDDDSSGADAEKPLFFNVHIVTSDASVPHQQRQGWRFWHSK